MAAWRCARGPGVAAAGRWPPTGRIARWAGSRARRRGAPAATPLRDAGWRAPGAIRATRRLLFAKQLLTDTRLPISRVALESGFQSLRRFNDAFRTAYRMAPRDLRRKPVTTADDALTIRLAYRPPYDFDAHLAFLRNEPSWGSSAWMTPATPTPSRKAAMAP
ncbi:MAG: helix-turn-helix domain-containing protein [Gemmatimonadaceae bacterium]